MEIWFASARLEKLFNSQSKLRGKYGPRMAGVIQQRLLDLDAVTNLEQMRSLPGNCHELSQNLKGLLAVHLVNRDRLAFRPADDPVPLRDDGSLDWALVTKIEIVAVGDYH